MTPRNLPPRHETLEPPSFEDGLQTAMDFLDTVGTQELAGKSEARHFIEISWDDNDDNLVDVRTRVKDRPSEPIRITSLAHDDEVFEEGEIQGDAGHFKLPDAKRFYFVGVLPSPSHILSSFARHISTYSDAEALLTAAKPYPTVCTNDSFFTFATSRTIQALTREPENMPAARALFEDLAVSRGGLEAGRFSRALGRSLVRDLAPPSEEPSMYDQQLSPEQMSAAVHAYEAAYGFEPGSFSSPYIYRSFAFSQVLHQRLARDGGEEILRTIRQQPTQFASMYMAAVLSALAEDPNRDTNKIAIIKANTVGRNNAGEENLLLDALVQTAQNVIHRQRQKAGEASEAPVFKLLDRDSMHKVGESLATLLSLTHSNSDVNIRNAQQEQDRIYCEVVDMLLVPTRRTIGKTALGPQADTEQ